jgi:hypothetical protein
MNRFFNQLTYCFKKRWDDICLCASKYIRLSSFKCNLIRISYGEIIILFVYFNFSALANEYTVEGDYVWKLFTNAGEVKKRTNTHFQLRYLITHIE